MQWRLKDVGGGEGLVQLAKVFLHLPKSSNQTLAWALRLTSGAVALSLIVETGRYLKRRAEHGLLKAELEKKASVSNLVMVVVLTGGPCAGKSTAMTHLKEAFRRVGVNVMVVPEVPTLLIQGGAVYPGINGGKKLIEFETHLLKLQLQVEDSFIGIARSLNKPVVVLCDRGALDISAYLLPHDWSAVLSGADLLPGDLLRRYDVVVHMVTAADGAEAFYTRANNTARTEDAREARILDKRVRMSWSGHPRLVVVDNSSSGGFKAKVERVSQAVVKEVHRFGLPPCLVPPPPSPSSSNNNNHTAAATTSTASSSMPAPL